MSQIDIRVKDLSGMRFGQLLVIKWAGASNRKRHALWLCICDCGTQKIIPGARLRDGNTRSCGCLVKQTQYSRLRKGLGEAARNSVYSRYKNGAERAGRTWALSMKDFEVLTQNNCYYCGIEPYAIYRSYRNTGDFVYNGLDRVDNSKGYEITNIVPCCKVCNHAKATMTREEFLTWATRVVKYNVLQRDAAEGI